MTTSPSPACEPLPDDDPLAVIVVSFGAPQLLRGNLAAMTLPGPPGRVIVVDNFRSAQDRRANAAIADAAGWTFLPMTTNLGFGAAVNVGVRHALTHGAKHLLVLNPDARIDPDGVSALRDAIRADPMVLVSPVIVDGAGRLWFRGMRTDPRTGDVSAVPNLGPTGELGPQDWVSGACLMLSHSLWSAAGGFDEDYFLYWEDVDFSRRCVRAGGRLRVLIGVLAQHDAGGTQIASASAGKSPLYYYYNCRNRLLFAAKHLPGRDRLRWAVATPGASKRILYRGGRRQLVQSPKPLMWTLAGSAAGLLALLARSLPVIGSRR
ncbi:glycosyl transferase family 2 [Nakamurella multipartita DSM 44233]|uniref:Glycosyl transferase family 2 n=1 Tax=Nakamurella multipartita (strain ATCC 700099 / DSM 44233 / CIP 104796 / JCM 9543 / NBRC 105858 / Y-104) TaxID=479431 RepID=C8XKT1_NAKMY|nr:glycosyl transferase family 2 [Nakamurella multipartita DSM 44233]